MPVGRRAGIGLSRHRSGGSAIICDFALIFMDRTVWPINGQDDLILLYRTIEDPGLFGRFIVCCSMGGSDDGIAVLGYLKPDVRTRSPGSVSNNPAIANPSTYLPRGFSRIVCAGRLFSRAQFRTRSG